MHHATPLRFQIRLCRIFSCTAVLALAAAPAFGQFNPAGATISTTVGAQSLSAGTGTINSGGGISVPSGGTVALTMTGTSTLINNGTVQTLGSGRAIDSNSGTANLTVTNSGLISSVSTDAFRVNTNSAVSLVNSGTIQVTAGGQAIDWAAITSKSNTLTNQATGIITAVGEDAVRPGTNGVVINAGTISATVTGGASPTGSDGIDVRTFTGIQITNSGIISGRHGIATDSANNSSAITVNNNAGGLITAVNGSGLNIDGVFATVTANVTNANGATIRGGVLAIATDGDGDGIDVDGVLTLNNSGDVLGLGAKGGTNNAEGVAAGGGSITNNATGRIIGSSLLADAPNGDSSRGGNGILIDDSNGGSAVAATSVNNSGLIQGKAGFGIKFIGNLADTITNNAGGVIRGTGAAAAIDTGDGADTVTNSGTIQHDTGGTAVDLGGGNNTLNYNGGTIVGSINGGTGTNNTLNLGAGVTHNYATANFKNINVASGSASLVGIVSGLNLTKGGGGTLDLTAANTYSGTTTVAAGTLKVNNTSGSGTGTSNVIVNQGAALGGSGIVSGAVTVDGIIAPGNSIGTLNVNNTVTWNGTTGNQWNFELGGGNTSDKLNISGDFIKGTGSNFYFDFLNTGTLGTYVLIDWTGTTSFSASDFGYSNLANGLTGTFAFNGSQLEFTAIPEPSTTGLFAGTGILAFVLHLRRRRAAA